MTTKDVEKLRFDYESRILGGDDVTQENYNASSLYVSFHLTTLQLDLQQITPFELKQILRKLCLPAFIAYDFVMKLSQKHEAVLQKLRSHPCLHPIKIDNIRAPDDDAIWRHLANIKSLKKSTYPINIVLSTKKYYFAREIEGREDQERPNRELGSNGDTLIRTRLTSTTESGCCERLVVLCLKPRFLRYQMIDQHTETGRSVGVSPNIADRVDWGDVCIATLTYAAKNDIEQQESSADSTTASKAEVNSSSSDSKNMWTLKTGRKVEKVMEECARDYKVAHNYFTEDEREEISCTNPLKLPPLTPQMTEYLQKFENWIDLADPKKKKILNYIGLKHPILNALDIYYCGLLDKQVKSESDLLHRIGRPVYPCFDHSANLNATKGTKRLLGLKGGGDPSWRRKPLNDPEQSEEGVMHPHYVKKKSPKSKWEPARTFYSLPQSQATTEMRLKSAAEVNKSVNELELKVPKTMKDMLLRLIKLSLDESNKIITCGINISVSRFPVELQYPVTPNNLIQLFKSILATLYGTRVQ
ncbi:hypothetical protein BDC45DRAFT_539560 [Circinella umbellata]|nr:hypothetical protein BDC45DRAFT_539560 [Circinella umbellata]